MAGAVRDREADLSVQGLAVSLGGSDPAQFSHLRSGPPMILLQIVISGLLLGAIYALFSSGLALIWGMMNVINFAHGEFVMIGMYVAFLVVTFLNGGPLAFGPAAAALLFLFGIFVYYSLIRHVMRGPM